MRIEAEDRNQQFSTLLQRYKKQERHRDIEARNARDSWCLLFQGMGRCLNIQILKDSSNPIPLLVKEIDSLFDLVFTLR